MDPGAASRAARLGILVLSNGNQRVQKAFVKTAEEDSEDNGHIELFENLRKHLKAFSERASSAAVEPHVYKLTKRILRVIQMLCEGHMEWWQNFLREQPDVSKSIDIVSDCAALFKNHGEDFLQKVPSPTTLASLPDHDPRLARVQDALDVMIQAAATLTELCQGPCRGNQDKVISRHVPEICPRLLKFLKGRQVALQRSSDSGAHMSKERQAMREKRLKSLQRAELSIIQLLMAVVEGGKKTVVKQTIEALRKLVPGDNPAGKHDGVDGIGVLISNMNEHAKQELTHVAKTRGNSLFSASVGNRRVVRDSQGEVEAIADPILLHSKNADTINGYYILLQTLADKEKEPKQVAKCIKHCATSLEALKEALKGKEAKEASDYQQSHNEKQVEQEEFTPDRILSEIRGVVKKIEIVRHNETELVYFPIPMECVSQLKDGFVLNWRKKFKQEWNRDNANARVTDLVGKIDKYHAVHKHQKWISNTRVSCCRPLYYVQKAGLICDQWTVYNTLLINCLLVVGFTDPDEIKSELQWVNVQLYIQGLLHLLTSTVKVIVHFMQHPLLAVKQEQSLMEDFLRDPDSPAHFSRPRYWKTAARAGRSGHLHCCARTLSWSKLCFNDDFGKTVYMILCILCSALGALVDPFFFAFHLLELFFTVQLLQVALDAVGRNAKQLVLAVGMGLILTYCYAVLGWKLIIADENIPFEYGFDGGPEWGTNSTGVTFYDWVIIHWDMGLRDGPQHSGLWQSGRTPIQFIVLSITYYIIIVLILGAVISGIIIDAFSADRADKNKIDEDDREYDFVSGLPRSDFEQKNIKDLRFEDYVKQFHDPWNYLYYTVYLDEKDDCDFTGQESYVSEKVKNKDPHFFPIQRMATHLEGTSQDASDLSQTSATVDRVGASDIGKRDASCVTMIHFGTCFCCVLYQGCVLIVH